MKKITAVLLLITLSLSSVFPADSADEKKTEWPQWAKDIRRTEIITFGSLPFVTLWTTMIYSGIKYNRIGNPFDKSTSSFTTDDQKKIITYACIASAGLGLTDLVISIIKRNTSKPRPVTHDVITVMPLSNDFEIQDGNFVPLPPEEIQEIPKEYLQAGIENALF